MGERELKIRVGAAIDSSFNTVMASVVEATKKARKQINAETQASSKTSSDIVKKEVKERIGGFDSIVKAHSSAEGKIKKEVSAAARERIKDEKAAMREVERDLKDHNKKKEALAKENAKIFKQVAAEHAKGDKGGGPGGFFGAHSNASAIFRAGAGALGFAKRMATNMLQGMGLDMDAGSQLGKAVERQHLATTISNSAWITSGAGPAGSKTRVAGSEIQEEAMKTGIATGQSGENMLKGLDQYVKMTGDLKTARSLMEDMGKLSTANGASFEDMMQASAAIANALGDIPDKGKAIYEVMRTMSGQGQLGAIEIRDMAKNMGYLTAQARNFKIDPHSQRILAGAGVHNEIAQNVAIEGALAQMARSRGGKTTAKQATESANAFVRDLGSTNEIKNMQKRGLTPFMPGTNNSQVRDPFQMVLEVLDVASSKGSKQGININDINKLVPNQRARAVVNAAAAEYNEARTIAAQNGVTDSTLLHKAAMEAVTAAFDKQLAVTQSQKEIEEKWAIAMNDAKVKTQTVNDKLGLLADKAIEPMVGIIEGLLPVLELFGDTMIKFIPGFDTLLKDKKDEMRMKGNVGLARTATGELLKGFSKGEVGENAVERADMGIAAIDKEIMAAQNRVEQAKKDTGGFLTASDPKVLEAIQKLEALQHDREELKGARDRMADLMAQGVIKGIHEKPLKVHATIVEDKTKTPEQPGGPPEVAGSTSHPESTHDN